MLGLLLKLQRVPVEQSCNVQYVNYWLLSVSIVSSELMGCEHEVAVCKLFARGNETNKGQKWKKRRNKVTPYHTVRYCTLIT